MLALCVGFVCGLLSAALGVAYQDEKKRQESPPRKRYELTEDPLRQRQRRFELARWNGRPVPTRD